MSSSQQYNGQLSVPSQLTADQLVTLFAAQVYAIEAKAIGDGYIIDWPNVRIEMDQDSVSTFFQTTEINKLLIVARGVRE